MSRALAGLLASALALGGARSLARADEPAPAPAPETEPSITVDLEATVEDAVVDQVARRLGVSAGDLDALVQLALDPHAFGIRLRDALNQMQDQVLGDPNLGPAVRAILVLYQQRDLSWAVRARSEAETTGLAGVGLGVEAAYDLALCRLLGAAADGQLRTAAHGNGFSGTVQGTGCLPLFGNTIEMTVRGLADVRPGLQGRPLTPPGRISGLTIDADLRFLRFRWAWHQLDVMHLSFDFDFFEVERQPGAYGGYAIGGEVVKWSRRGRGAQGRDQVWRFVPLRFEGWGDGDTKRTIGDDGQVFGISGLGFEALALGPVGLDLDVGWTRGRALAEVGDDVRERATLGVAGQVLVGNRRVALSLGGRHDLDAALGGLVLEDRGALALEWRRTSTLARLEGWVSRQELIPVVGATRVETLGGGQLRHGLVLGRMVDLWVQLDVARSWYADQEDTSGEPRFTVRALASIVVELSSSRLAAPKPLSAY